MHTYLLNSIQAGGGTRFYDSLAETIIDKVLKSPIPNSRHVVLSLTDGADYGSSRYGSGDQVYRNMIDLIEQNDIALYILSIGQLSNAPALDRMTANSSKRLHESVSNVAVIAERFQNFVVNFRQGMGMLESF